ncbi:hypothetical protein SDC9_204200 [bioreactor metagenome]|uniref:Uncharacterized protein n=1 Tax=bioreactor metagenome TaxID=1076179 RepID=A0A645J018_9ZZZZ
MSIIAFESFSAIFATTSPKTHIVTHIIDFITIKVHFFDEALQVFLMHIQEPRVVVTESLHLVLTCIPSATINDICLNKIPEEMPFILCMLRSFRIMKQQNMMTMCPVQFLPLFFSPRTVYMITGIMLDKLNIVLVQFLLHEMKVFIQTTEIV